MKKILKFLFIFIPFVFILSIFVLDSQNEPEMESFYKLGLSGIKEQYNLGEKLTFSLYLNGYGSDCGSYEIQVKKGDKQIDGRTIEIDCTIEIADDFEFINIDITTLELILIEPGTYTIIGDFSNREGQKFQDKKILTVI